MKTKTKHMIGGVLITAGILAALGAIGHLDCLDARGESYGAAEVKKAIIKSAAGLAATCLGVFLCRDIEIEESEISSDELNTEEKENRAD